MNTLARLISTTLVARSWSSAGACSDDSSGPKPDGFSGNPEASVNPKHDRGTSIDNGTSPSSDAKVPPQTPPSFINGHVIPGCSPGLYQVNAGTLETTCTNIWSTPDDVLQVTSARWPTSPPRPAGSTRSSPRRRSRSTRPTARPSPSTSSSRAAFPCSRAASPSMPTAAATVTGSYLVQLSDGTILRGAFHADTCPAECD